MRKMLMSFAIVLGALVSAGAANYSGMCISQLRYLSDAEKIDAAVSYVLRRGWLPHDRQDTDYGYESVEQYRELVPNCCVADIRIVGGMGLSPRLLGRLATIVSIANVPRATAEAVSPSELSAIVGGLRDNQHYVIPVSNCGRARDLTD